jgi:hypothetical protein
MDRPPAPLEAAQAILDAVVRIEKIVVALLRNDPNPWLPIRPTSSHGALRPIASKIEGKYLVRKSILDESVERHSITPEKTLADKSALNEALTKCIQRAKANIEHREGR